MKLILASRGFTTDEIADTVSELVEKILFCQICLKKLDLVRF